MKLIVGLGNPGRDYEFTRHNIGFMVLERMLGDGNWGNEAKANALISRLRIGNEEVILALPQSYMNLSGEVIVELLRWFKIKKDDLIVVHDDLDLPFGVVQIKKNIGPAGHNGIKSIVERLGEDFIRVRVGIGAEDNKMPSEKYVLGKFSSKELKEIENIEKKAIEKMKLIIKHGYEEYISKYNSKS